MKLSIYWIFLGIVYLLKYLNQVFQPLCQQLNVQADKNVHKADFGHL